MNIKSLVTGAIRSIFSTSKGCEFDVCEFLAIEKDLKVVENYFGITAPQAIILSVIFSATCRGRMSDLGDIISHINVDPIDVLLYTSEFEALVKSNIVYRTNTKPKNRQTILSDSFTVNPAVIKAIVESRPLPSLNSRHCKSNLELLELIYDIVVETDSWGEEDCIDVPRELSNILICNPELGLVKRFKAMNLACADIYVFCLVTWRCLNGSSGGNLNEIISKYYKQKLDRVKYFQYVLRNNCQLALLNLCDFEPGGFYNDVEVLLTDKSLKLLEEEGVKIGMGNKVKNKNALTPQGLVTKELFFNENEQKQIDMIAEILSEKEYKKMQQKLLANSLPSGITIMFYGSSGLGKTEAVYQLAKKSKREILPVDLSNVRSKWFGESEHKIKKIFDDYSKFQKESTTCPILFINESDGILGKRKSVNDSPIAETQNNLQNILLDQLERFSGIIICTTNLIINLDSAFSRRFLFKLEFSHPNIKVREMIWKAKLKNLTDDEYINLARYEMTGAQIENVVRKYTMQLVLYEKVCTQDLYQLCQQEALSFGAVASPIGFRM